jgi:LysM repeat protein
MRQRLTKIGVFLLVFAVIVVGLGACARSAAEREAPTTESGATAVSSGSTSGEASAPAPGETVVSAVTPVSRTPGAVVPTTPGAEGQPTSVTGGETPAASEPTTAAAEATTAPTQPPASSGQTGTIWHTVQRGETTYSIARRYGTTVEAIAQANGLLNPSQIFTGQQLKIPTSGGTSSSSSSGTTGCRIRHTVQRGEWVWQIARNYGVSPYDILAANGLTIQTANTIYAGTVLCIP